MKNQIQPKLVPGDFVINKVLFEEEGLRLEGEVIEFLGDLEGHPKPGPWYRVAFDTDALNLLGMPRDVPFHEDVLVLVREAM